MSAPPGWWICHHDTANFFQFWTGIQWSSHAHRAFVYTDRDMAERTLGKMVPGLGAFITEATPTEGGEGGQ